MKFCVNCGKKIEDDTKFCPYCGAKQITNSNSQTNSQPTQHQNDSESKQTANTNIDYQPVYNDGDGAYATEEMQLNQEEQQLTPQEQMAVETEVSNEAKQPVVAWLLWFFLGGLGAHRFYLHKDNAVTMLVLDIIGWITTIILVGFILLLIIGIWWLVDAFNIEKWIKQDRLHIKSMIINNMLRQKNINN